MTALDHYKSILVHSYTFDSGSYSMNVKKKIHIKESIVKLWLYD